MNYTFLRDKKLKRTTPKTLAIRIEPNLKSQKNVDGTWSILGDNKLLVKANTSQSAWEEAYHLLAVDKFKVGDLLVMEGCVEAKSHKNKIWKCRYPSYLTDSGCYAVFLEGMAGYFCSEFLRKATTEEINTHMQQVS